MSARRLSRPLVRGVRGVCACGHPLGTTAALDAFRAGGTAADAAVAAALALSVVLPDACGLGGDAFALVQRAGERAATAYNGSGRAPALMTGAVPVDGGGTVAVPGAIAAWWDILGTHGALDPEQLLAPAVRLAREGFPLGGDTGRALGAHRARLARGAPDHALSAPGLRTGSLIRQPVLATTLERLAEHGPSVFYAGGLAEQIARAVQDDGGMMTVDDLAAHSTEVLSGLLSTRLGRELVVAPPVSQAALIPVALGSLERAAPTGAASRLHAAVEAIEAAFAYRHELTSGAAAERLLRVEPPVIDLERAARRGGPRSDAHTTAIATADSEGTLVSMLISVFDDFGSSLWVHEGGFLLNDRLQGFTAPGSTAVAGARPVSTLSPALLANGSARMALGTPGSDGQVQTIVQLVVALDDGLSIEAALDRPRVRSVDGRLAVEEDVEASVLEALRRLGHDVWVRPPGEPRFGAAVAAGVEEDSGTLWAASDPRREAWAAAL